MVDPIPHDPAVRPLRCAVVLRVREDECDVLGDRGLHSARFAAVFPSPRTERVHPGHLVAVADAPDGTETVLWRWFDAVVLEDGPAAIRLWEPAHGEVLARARPTYVAGRPGTRAYLSAGLPGADWWVAGPVVADARDADVELDEVARFFETSRWWDTVD